MKSCPTCSRNYPIEQEFCSEDGTPLRALASGQATVPDGPPAFTNRDFPSPMDAAPLPAGAQVGEYIVEKQIGEGGMGVIFSGVHPLIGKQVAIKVLNPAMAHNPDVVARFIQEAKSVNQIRHRNIVDIFSFGTLPDGRHYFVMEFLDGEPLSSRLKEGPMAEAEALSVLQQTVGALEAAHAKGIVHRDLKPDNVFLSPGADGPFVKVLDFGIAKLLGDTGGMTKTSTGMPMGTPLYMSPEQAAGGKVDHRTDLYALGIMIYEIVSGVPPFNGSSVIAVLSAQLNDPPPPLESYAEVNPELRLLIEQLLAKEPEARPPSMTEVRQRLATFKELHGSGAILWQRKSGEGKTRTVTRARKSGSPLLALALGGIATVGAAVVGLKLVPHKQSPAPVVAPAPAPAPVPAAPTTGRLIVSTNALGTKIFLDEPHPDGTVEKAATPAAAGGMNLKVQVPAGRDLVLRVEADGYKPVTMPIKVTAGDETALPVVLVAEAPAPPPPAPATPGATKRGGHASAKKPDGKPAETPARPADKGAQNENLMNPFQ